MRALLFHCKNYSVKIDSMSNRPEDITPEKVNEKEQKPEIIKKISFEINPKSLKGCSHFI